MDDITFTFDVAFTTHRPVRPDEHTHRLTWTTLDRGLAAAHLQAAQWVASRPGVVMVTRTTLVDAVL